MPRKYPSIGCTNATNDVWSDVIKLCLNNLLKLGPERFVTTHQGSYEECRTLALGSHSRARLRDEEARLESLHRVLRTPYSVGNPEAVCRAGNSAPRRPVGTPVVSEFGFEVLCSFHLRLKPS